MTIVEFLILLLIAAIAGSLGQMLAGYDLGGLLVSIVVGFVGAFIGLWLARELNLPEFFTIRVDDKVFPVIWSIVGSAIFAAIVGLLTRRSPVIY